MPRGALTLLALAALFSGAAAAAEGVPEDPLLLEPIATGFRQVTTVANSGDGSGRLFVVERHGTVRVITDSGRVLDEPFLNLGDLLETGSLEQGLLALAFHPAYEENGYFYVAYTDLVGDAVVARYRVSAADPDVADLGSASEVLTLLQPSPLHNIMSLAFAPDERLVVGSGDGGPAGDPDGRGQSLDVLHGKILRLDVDPELYSSGYGIPDDNPFVGVPGAREEIWALGLRNPANLSFDRSTGDLYVADVGQDLWEEVNFEAAAAAGGRNYGWSIMEGAHCFNPPTGCDPTGLIVPAAEYRQDVDGDCAVIGGYVYRGTASPSLAGQYLFGDFCSGTLRSLRAACGGWTMEVTRPGTFQVSALGEDEDGEIYVAEWTGDASGTLFRLARASTHTIFSDDFETGTLGAWSACRP